MRLRRPVQDGDTTQGWRPGDREQVAVVSFSHAIQHSYVAVLGIAYPFVLASFHTTYAVLGVILSATGLAGGLLQGLAGVVRRFSARAMLSAQNFGMAIASIFGALAPGIGLFAAARLLGTVTSWPQHPVGSAHLTERVPHRRGLVLAAHTTGGNLGTLLAPLLGATVIAVAGWRVALGVTGALLAAGSLLTWARIRPLDATRGTGLVGRGETDGVADASGGYGTRVTLRQALRRRRALAVLGAGVISGAGRGLGVLTTYMPAYLHDGLHESALTLGAVMTVVSIGAVFGPMLWGHLSDVVGRRPVLYGLYACGALALGSFVLVGSNVVLIGAVGLCVGVFTYSEQPIRQALFADSMQGVAARTAFAAYFGLSQSLGALWLVVIGFLITDVGYRPAFFVMGGSFVVAAAVIALFAREPRGPSPEPLPAPLNLEVQ